MCVCVCVCVCVTTRLQFQIFNLVFKVTISNISALSTKKTSYTGNQNFLQRYRSFFFWKKDRYQEYGRAVLSFFVTVAKQRKQDALSDIRDEPLFF